MTGISLSSDNSMLDDNAKHHSKYLGLQKVSEQEQAERTKKIARDTSSTLTRRQQTKKATEREKVLLL